MLWFDNSVEAEDLIEITDFVATIIDGLHKFFFAMDVTLHLGRLPQTTRDYKIVFCNHSALVMKSHGPCWQSYNSQVTRDLL